jgi:hypothetical protein
MWPSLLLPTEFRQIYQHLVFAQVQDTNTRVHVLVENFNDEDVGRERVLAYPTFHNAMLQLCPCVPAKRHRHFSQLKACLDLRTEGRELSFSFDIIV